jgi:hypothetical protein
LGEGWGWGEVSVGGHKGGGYARGGNRSARLGLSESTIVVSPRARATTMSVTGCCNGSANFIVFRTACPSKSNAACPLMASCLSKGICLCMAAP